MNEDNRVVKAFIKNLAPNEAIDLMDKYNIPSPYKEVIISACVYRKEGFAGCDFLAEKYKIHLSYWNFGKKLKEGLIMFRKAYNYSNS